MREDARDLRDVIEVVGDPRGNIARHLGQPDRDPRCRWEGRFECVNPPLRVIDGIRILPPASFLVFEPGRGVRADTTWRLRYRPRHDVDHAGARGHP